MVKLYTAIRVPRVYVRHKILHRAEYRLIEIVCCWRYGDISFAFNKKTKVMLGVFLGLFIGCSLVTIGIVYMISRYVDHLFDRL